MSNSLNIEAPSSVLKRYGLQAKKSWGQCFLQDLTMVQRIADAAHIAQNSTVIEIGAGLGTLTQALGQKSSRVVAVERDRDLAQILRQEFANNPHVEIREENALNFDFGQWGQPVQVVGNLPYNISSPILFHLINFHHIITSATLMLQLEVAERLVASPGSRTYGIPSVLIKQVADATLCFKVSRGAFFPRPNVDSAIVRLDMLAQPRVSVSRESLQKIVRSAFGQRRKTLRNALSSLFPREDIDLALEKTGIEGTRRGETLSLEEFASLAEHLEP